MASHSGSSDTVLLCRSGSRLYALPLANVRETMRALPVDPMPAMPEFLLGLSLIRGTAVPVLDCAKLARSETSTAPSRYVTLALGERQAALAVDAVLGVRTLSTIVMAEAAPLLDDAGHAPVQKIAALDAELLMVLQAARLIPESLWEAVASQEEGA
ncbi:chemotaxis protein CheW [Pseudoduganella violacea]|nr:chemotaxis protein CheW [Pseudoduganella violacea]